MKTCAYCNLPCKGYARGTDRDGNEIWFHHGDDDPFDIEGLVMMPSCYEKAQWEAHGEESLLDYIAMPKENR